VAAEVGALSHGLLRFLQTPDPLLGEEIIAIMDRLPSALPLPSDLPVLVAHGQLIVDVLPQVDALLRQLMATPTMTHAQALRIERIVEVITLEDICAILPLLGEQDVAVVVLDLPVPYLSGQTLLEHLTTDYPDFPVIVVTPTSDLETAVQCMQAGAIDYLVKPMETNWLVAVVWRALEVRALRAEVLSLKERLLTDAPPHREAFAEIITQSKAMHAIFRYVEAIARSPQPVLITGETGTGKELIARAIHRLAGGHGEFVAVNVAGLDNTMFSDTLFGHQYLRQLRKAAVGLRGMNPA
jgi:DNA-binding NtrC family response regulator